MVKPAYGRDYDNAEDVKDAWDSGKDFTITQGDDYGRKVNCLDKLKDHGYDAVKIYYNKVRKTLTIAL